MMDIFYPFLDRNTTDLIKMSSLPDKLEEINDNFISLEDLLTIEYTGNGLGKAFVYQKKSKCALNNYEAIMANYIARDRPGLTPQPPWFSHILFSSQA